MIKQELNENEIDMSTILCPICKKNVEFIYLEQHKSVCPCCKSKFNENKKTIKISNRFWWITAFIPESKCPTKVRI